MKDRILNIPDNWEVKTIKSVSKILDNKRVPLSSEVRSKMKGNIPYCGANGIVDYINDYIFDEELILLAEDGGNFQDYQNRPIAYYMYGKCWVNNHAHVLSSKNGHNKFLFYSLEHMDITKYIIGGTRTKLNKSTLESIEILYPPLPEQQKIAEILTTVDDKIEVIDQQIEQTQKLKKGLMQKLLTGKYKIDNDKIVKRNEAFKDSDLGKIPENWETIPIYELRNKDDRYSFTGGPFGSDLKSEHYTSNGVRIIQLQNIGNGKFNDKYSIYTSEKKADELKSCNIYPNEIILAKMMPVAQSCKIPNSAERFVMCSDGIRLSVDKSKFDNDFVFHAINTESFKKLAEQKSTGTTRLRIGLSELKTLPIAIPKELEEQKNIAKTLNLIDTKTQVLESKKLEYSELKKGLMQKLLTGKIRVKV